MKLSSSVQSSQDKTRVVRTSWQSFLGCTDGDFDTKKTSIFLHTKNGPDPIDNDNEIYVLEWKDGGTIVSVSAKMFERVSEILQESLTDVEWTIRSNLSLTQKHWPQLGYYQFDSLIYPVSEHIKQLTSEDAAAYEVFMNACVPQDQKKVCMDFSNPFHTFFAYIQDGKILSVGNYIRSDNDDQIAHIGIITLSEAKWKWYATEVVKGLLNDISIHGFIPQWRAHGDNHVSQKIAEEFGFVELLRTYSLIAG